MRQKIVWAVVCMIIAISLYACSSSSTNSGAGSTTLTTISVTPASPSILAGTSQQFTALGTYSDNSSQNITSSVTWSSSDTSKASISIAGLATAVSAGTTTIMANSGSISGSTIVTITGLPSSPTSVAAVAGDSQVTIKWDAISTATSYDIYWSTSPGVTKTNYTGKISDIATTITTTNYTHLGRTNGTTYYYRATAKNTAGESSESNEVSATPRHDTTAPINTTGTNFINNGAYYATSCNSFTLGISATDDMALSGYWFSQSSNGAPDPQSSGWLTITPTKAFSDIVPYANIARNEPDFCFMCTLSPGNVCCGTFTVNVWFKDTGGNVSASSGDSISVDNGAPVNSTLSNNFINGGASNTSTLIVTLAISATDACTGVAGYYISESSTTPSATAGGWSTINPSTTSYSANVSYTLSSGGGTKMVYVWFKDVAGNVSQSVSDSIIYAP